MPGYTVRINGQQNGMVGYDGEVFIPNLLKQNKLEVDLLDHGSCQVDFTYNSNQYSTKIGTLCMSLNIMNKAQIESYKFFHCL